MFFYSFKNGLTTAAIDNNGPISHLVLAFRAGSRYENAQIRRGLSLVWSSGSSGSKVWSFASRDVFGVSLSVPRDQAPLALSILGHVTAQPAFKPWELQDVVPTLHADRDYRNPIDIAIEDAHRAAFRTGSLANSLYAARHDIGNIKSSALVDFAAKQFVTGNGVLVGVNVDAEQLEYYGSSNAPINHGPAASFVPSPYVGGDWRRSAASSNTTSVVFAGLGAGSADFDRLAVQAVLLESLNRACRSLQKNSSGVTFSAQPVQFVYEGAGLVGIQMTASGNGHKDVVGDLVSKTISTVKNAKFDKIEELRRAVANNIKSKEECSQTTAVKTAVDVLSSSADSEALPRAISKVRAEDVKAALAGWLKKPSLSAYGSIANVPYVDQI
ncbi:unnamed protein product [Caenorhabditis auriculariae]|uniref:Peptidase M16 N-terminal domain-containing protein n=1 Tax=Caenorhabditis auriculariae TaxID=2777116 RepID=A0A8S1HRH2_9PELO|nr:unnamed protein product [Caenorhabditis auriculariae]